MKRVQPQRSVGGSCKTPKHAILFSVLSFDWADVLCLSDAHQLFAQAQQNNGYIKPAFKLRSSTMGQLDVARGVTETSMWEVAWRNNTSTTQHVLP